MVATEAALAAMLYARAAVADAREGRREGAAQHPTLLSSSERLRQLSPRRGKRVGRRLRRERLLRRSASRRPGQCGLPHSGACSVGGRSNLKNGSSVGSFVYKTHYAGVPRPGTHPDERDVMNTSQLLRTPLTFGGDGPVPVSFSERAVAVTVVPITMSRLLLLLPLLWGISHSRLVAVWSLLAIVAFDVADGTLARAVEKDGASRRLADAAVDKLIVNAACVGFVIHDPTLVLLYVPFAVRDVALVIANGWCIARRRILIGSRPSHKAGAAALATLGLLALSGLSGAALVFAAAVACAVNWAPLPEYIRAFRVIRARESSRTFTVLPTTMLSIPRQR